MSRTMGNNWSASSTNLYANGNNWATGIAWRTCPATYCEAAWNCHEYAAHYCAKHNLWLCSRHWYRDHAPRSTPCEPRPRWTAISRFPWWLR